MKRQPSEGAFDDPALGQDLEACIGALDNFKAIPKHRFRPCQAPRLVATINKDFQQVGQDCREPDEQQANPSGIGNVRSMDGNHEQQTQGVDGDMLFAALHFFAIIEPALPPFCVVFTDRLSMIATLGKGFLPACSRTRSRKTSWIMSHFPLNRHCR